MGDFITIDSTDEECFAMFRSVFDRDIPDFPNFTTVVGMIYVTPEAFMLPGLRKIVEKNFPPDKAPLMVKMIEGAFRHIKTMDFGGRN